jgi:hypothetical protein
MLGDWLCHRAFVLRTAPLRVAALRASIAIAALSLTACGSATGDSAADDVRNSLAPTADVTIWTDPSSGCRYYIYAEGLGSNRIGGMTIRFNENGAPDCHHKQSERTGA